MQQFSIKMVEEGFKRMAPDALPLPEDYHIRLPDLTLSERLTIFLGDHSFQLLHMPGHTPSELAVYIPEERVVCTSDNVVTSGQPFLHQAVPYEWLESLKKIQQLDVDVIIPGHGEICDRSYIPKMSNIIITWINIIKESIKKGWSVDEAQNNIRIQDYFPDAPDNNMVRQMQRTFIANLYEKLK
jgi:cyclase